MLAGATLFLVAISSFGADTAIDEAQVLRAEYTSLTGRLGQNQFNRALVLDSIESGDQLKGEIYAVMNFPFTQMESALIDPAQWCEVLILHFNTKFCRANTEGAEPVLQVNIGKKTPQNLTDSDPIKFTFSVIAATAETFDIALAAKQGPLGSSDYRITLRAIPLPGHKTFIQLKYSYNIGWAGQVATQAYLATLGRGKVGFTFNGRDSNGQIEYVNGIRGVIERNTMRYFLAIDSYMESISEPKDAQFEKRLHLWFFSCEKYARQLHEMSWEQYVEMKSDEHTRMLKDPSSRLGSPQVGQQHTSMLDLD